MRRPLRHSQMTALAVLTLAAALPACSGSGTTSIPSMPASPPTTVNAASTAAPATGATIATTSSTGGTAAAPAGTGGTAAAPAGASGTVAATSAVGTAATAVISDGSANAVVAATAVTRAPGTVFAPALNANAGQAYRLGLVAADARTIAALTVIRHELAVTALPAAVDLAAKMPAVGNQGQEGSCVSWATAYAMRGYEARNDVWSTIAPKSTDPARNFSPAFVYNQINGGHDNGSTIPGALTLLQKKGAATLADMPYVAGQFTVQPPTAAFADAAHYKLASYGYIAPTDVTSMKAQIAAGLPVIVAIKVYNNFFALGAGQIYTSTGGGYAGGHALTAVGYDDAKQAVEVINSWGTTWGSAGFGWISYTALRQITLEAYSAVDDHGMPPKATPVSIAPTPAPTVQPSAAPNSKLGPT